MADVQAVLSALRVFNGAPDKTSLEEANTWLQDFQHSPEAWTTCNVLLLSPDAPPPAKLFAAQTFRTKVTYDLDQVNSENRMALRDTLLAALQTYHTGPRTIIVQLCLAVAGLALQLPAWENPVQTMIETFGKNPATVPVFLQFLTLLPEELNTNTRIPLTDEEYGERAPKLLTRNAHKVLDILSMYIQAQGVTTVIQREVFGCLRSWLVAGEVPPVDLVNTPLFTFAFEALDIDELFDIAIDVLCELVNETQEIQDNIHVIQVVLPRIIDLKSRLVTDHDDAEKFRGYTRLFSQAGETYRTLLVEDPDMYYPLVTAIGECSAYHDLDIVPITFPFWMRVAQMLGKKATVPPFFQDAYKTLMSVVIGHLRFPADISTLTGQEADNFRSFRHVMGDTLKDCCAVLRTDTCLHAAYQLITTALAKGPNNVTWQEIEAPLFAMRSMGAEIDNGDKVAVPKILDLIPQLPSHPRVRYASLLIIARYTEWINEHPEYIHTQLQYISTGFEDTDAEVNAAAGQALKYLCQDSKQHLVDFLPTLHTFLKTTGFKLIQDDRRQVYEAIAHVISAMPMERAAESLRTFALDILALVHGVTTKPNPTKEELEQASNGLENLETMFYVIRSFGEELPSTCQNSCGEAWTIFDNFLLKFGTNYDLAERATRVIRHGITFFGNAGLPVAPSVAARMSQGFDATGIPSYIWIGGKIVARYGDEKQNVELQTAIRGMYELVSKKAVSILSVKAPGDIPDVLQDYIQMLLPLVDITPNIFFDQNIFPSVFRASLAGLTVVHSDIVFATLDLFRAIIMHECLRPDASGTEHTQWATVIRGVVREQGYDLTGYLLSGMIGEFPEDAIANVVSIFRVMTTMFSQEMLQWLPGVLQQLPSASAPNQAKSQFLVDLTAAVNERNYDRVKYSILTFNRMSRKARERRRVGL
ncbi:ARM repeat-containing protein [Macrolepiota fuliginosa MF-IS2]|uniref:ARM repeat-containing protein n=1 Tax=Macrolepiota fuliginosa MF-IS2 TaxID=1400762 RepID=A0A9P5XRB2_9AGAR|nr:ARM repeat-containing protein [Macrolepiota fuliginosa MF-IS2]